MDSVKVTTAVRNVKWKRPKAYKFLYESKFMVDKFITETTGMYFLFIG